MPDSSMENGLIIREIQPDDIDHVSRIYARSWKAAYAGIVPQAYLDDLKEDRWSPILAESPFTSLVLLDEGRYAGTSASGGARDETLPGWGEIVSIYLLPEYCGRGYGEKLLDAAVSSLKQKGYADIYLWVLAENMRARRFYERHQLRFSGDTKCIEIGGASLPEVRYVRHIG